MSDDEARQTVIVECELDEPPGKVWRALTIPEFVAAWLAPNDIRPEAGHSFTFNAKPSMGRDIACEVLAVEPNRLISYRWREDRAEGEVGTLDSVVTFVLTETRTGGTHLRLVHGGFSLIEMRSDAARLAGMLRMASNPMSERRPPHHRHARRQPLRVVARLTASGRMRWAA